MCTIFNFRRVEFPWTSFWSRCWRQIASDRTICKNHLLTMAAPSWRPLGDHLVTTWWYRKQRASNYCFAKVNGSEVFSWNLWPMCSRGPESLSSDCQCQLVCPVATWTMAGCTSHVHPSLLKPVRSQVQKWSWWTFVIFCPLRPPLSQLLNSLRLPLSS